MQDKENISKSEHFGWVDFHREGAIFFSSGHVSKEMGTLCNGTFYKVFPCFNFIK